MVTMYRQRHQGFTIVELLIMVAIIATLATFTIFAFGSWRTRTARTEVKTALSSLSASLKNELTFNNTYPATVPSSYQPSNGVTISYKSTATSYCASGTSTAVPTVVWYITDASPTPTQTSCS